MTSAETETRKSEREFSRGILSASFTLLGLLIGFYGIISSAIGEAIWKDELSELLPFLPFLSVAIALDCLLSILAVLGMAGYLKVQVPLTVLTCVLLALIAGFIGVRSVQLWF